MARILNSVVLLGVICLATSTLAAGCAASSGAGRILSQASTSIEEHNRLLDRAHATYGRARREIEAGKASSGDARRRLREAGHLVFRARGRLSEARDKLKQVSGMDVAPAVRDYAALLARATGVQLRAEGDEAKYYRMLEKNTSSGKDSESALRLVLRANAEYRRARTLYHRAQRIAASHPRLIPGGTNRRAGIR
ncbi:hypothetical protein [Rubrobacter calidifluminis]|uniref:hypothetical protein n=1 Tax=Rubrobacter calidifluminis TaxID=1392640 RepID=UPI00235EAA9A|nr:hypothetical protein [Rubrobacter calidifluminis]